MEENQENDSQEVQPDQKDEQSDEEVVNPEVEKLKEELKDKDERIANLSSKQRELKKEAKESKKSDEKIIEKSDELDYGQLAYLEAKGIKEGELEFVQEQLVKFGKDAELKDLLANDYFIAQLKTRREAESIKEATPSNTRAGGESPSTKPEFWIAQDKMPPATAENWQLRADIVNKKMELAKNKRQFTDQPLIEGSSEFLT